MATIRERSGKLIADFRYMGIRCRETTNLEDNAYNRRILKKRLEQLEAEITLGTFEYEKYFPKSKRVDEFKEKRQKMLDNKIDVTAFLTWYIKDYPQSRDIMKQNPNFQYKFK